MKYTKGNGMLDTQEHARQFNEEEAIWRRFQEKRALRRLRGDDSPFCESLLDQLDWQEAATRDASLGRRCLHLRALSVSLK